MKRLLTIEEVAEVLKVSKATVYRLVSEGELPVIRFRGSVRIGPDSLHRFLQDHGEMNR